VGGHCIAVDPWFIVDSASDEAQLIRSAREVNDSKPEWLVARIKAAILDICAKRPGSSVPDIKVACLGLAFKPDIDDLRESPALEITSEISKLECRVLAVEPNIEALPSRLVASNISLVSLEEAIDCADVICVLVKHKQFDRLYEIDLQKFVLVDAVGIRSRRNMSY
jgi:UDP-N-acetyl-D-mannosaminuronic acid dehydrogenase